MSAAEFDLSAPALISAANLIREKAAENRRVLVTLDGPCASGKTTLAGALAGEVGARVLHTDDFVVPHKQKTAERLAIPGGNCDWERLTAEVIAPWKRGLDVNYRCYDCQADLMLPPRRLGAEGIVILEGCYCNLPAIRQWADVCLFMDVPESVRMERLRRRETPEALQRFYDRWIPLENAYFEAWHLPDDKCLIIHLS